MVSMIVFKSLIYEEVVLQRVKNAASNYLRLKELKKLTRIFNE